MTCPNCGTVQPDTAKFCNNCGATLPAAPPPQSYPHPIAEGRGGVILALGILSIIMLGPLTGIPAWVMGHNDMKKIRSGMIVQSEKGLTQAGMILGIIGTILGLLVIMGIVIALMVAFFTASTVY
jgi:hypothetical protein